jgi:hypothetical protein
VTADPLWQELDRLESRDHARYEDRFGRCDICRLGATLVRVITGITWAGCRPCGTRWSVGSDVLQSVHDPALLRTAFLELAALTIDLPSPQESAMKSETVQHDTPESVSQPFSEPQPFDPRILYEKALWGIQSREARERIFAAVVRDLALFPLRHDASGRRELNEDHRWQRVRGDVVTPNGLTIEQLFARENISPASWAIRDLVRLLIDRNEQRSHLRTELAMLDRLFGSDQASKASA